MSHCGVGKTCESPWGSVAVVPGGASPVPPINQRTPLELVESRLWSECLGLQLAEPNTLRIRNFLLAVAGTAAAAEVPLLWRTADAVAAQPVKQKKAEESYVIPYVVGGVGVAAGAWALLEHLRLSSDRMAFTQLRCREVLDRINAHWGLKPEDMHFEEMGCAGVRVLTEGCTPVRRIASTTEWSTEPVSPATVALVVGGVVLAAVAWEVVVPWMIASTPASPLVPAAALAL